MVPARHIFKSPTLIRSHATYTRNLASTNFTIIGIASAKNHGYGTVDGGRACSTVHRPICSLHPLPHSPNAFLLDLFGFEKYTFLAGGGWSSHPFSTRLRVLKLRNGKCDRNRLRTSASYLTLLIGTSHRYLSRIRASF